MTSFKSGDLVKLKSGGPVMTVDNIVHRTVNCIWFEGKDIKGYSFGIDTIEIYTPPKLTDSEKTLNSMFS